MTVLSCKCGHLVLLLFGFIALFVWTMHVLLSVCIDRDHMLKFCHTLAWLRNSTGLSHVGRGRFSSQGTRQITWGSYFFSIAGCLRYHLYLYEPAYSLRSSKAGLLNMSSLHEIGAMSMQQKAFSAMAPHDLGFPPSADLVAFLISSLLEFCLLSTRGPLKGTYPFQLNLQMLGFYFMFAISFDF